MMDEYDKYGLILVIYGLRYQNTVHTFCVNIHEDLSDFFSLFLSIEIVSIFAVRFVVKMFDSVSECS